MKRLLALLAAVGMVVGAILIRQARDERGDDASDGSGSGRDAVSLVCSTELRPACETLEADVDGIEVRIEAPGRTADRLVDPEARAAGFDLWLVDAAWPGIVADNRRVANLSGRVLADASDVLARSPALLMVRSNQRDRVAGLCEDGITWTCVGDPSNRVTVGLEPPDDGGLAVLAGAVADHLDTAAYAANDFEDGGFDRWFGGLTDLKDVRLGGRSALAAGVTQQGRFDVVGALEATAATVPRGLEVYEPIYPDPVVTSDVVLVPAARGAVEDAAAALDRLGGAERLRDLLAGHGWRTGPAPLADLPAAPELPPRPGTPKAGVLQVLRDRW